MSSPLVAFCLWYFGGLGIFWATIISNLIGGLVFFWIDRKILKK